MSGGRACADGAVLGATLRTLDPVRPAAAAVAWRSGVIVAVGDDAEVRACCDARTELIDGSGLVVTPGLVDAHIHPFYVEQTRGVDLSGVGSRSELGAALRAHRDAHPDEEWLLGWGLEYGAFEGGPIRGEAIVEAVGDVPASLTFMDQHTAVVTPSALLAAGVSGEETFAEAAEVVVGPEGPTGELREQAAMALVRDVVPRLSAAAVKDASVRFLAGLNEVGLTGAHVMNGDPAGLDMLREIEASAGLSVRLVYPLWQQPEMSIEQMRGQLRHVAEHGRRWRCGVAKFFIDGVIDSGTAWLYEPDAQGEGTAPFWPDPEHYLEAVELFADAGFQCVTHAVGDRAVAAALDAYARAAAAPAPHRVEHIETLQDRDLARFGPRSPAASMQPLHMQWRKADGSDTYASRLGPERTARGFPARSILDRGALLALGSDWPVAQFDPRIGMAWARLRRQPGARGAEPFEPEQRLTGEQALAGYTRSCARIVGEPKVSGSIAVGMRADLTAFAADPVDCDPDDLPELPVALTVVDGELVYPWD